MALIKNETLNTGVVVNYHIPSVTIDGHSDKVREVTMLKYLNKEAREAGKRPVERKNIKVNMSKNDFTLPALYALIKEAEIDVRFDENGNFFLDDEGNRTIKKIKFYADAVSDE